ncbi:MAG: sigma-70 family RNA polymerase sigma factor [Anaerolineae bacterium]|nr:sigma-70 family RNA polymerase sigma factor [Anaerolineae bacterium]
METARLSRAQQGDKEAFSELVEQYHPQVFSLCYRMLGNPHDAEDAAQETFLRAYRAMKRYDPKKKFITWLLSIAANYCIDQHRKKKAVLIDLEQAPQSQLRATNPGIEAQMIHREQQEKVQALLGSLKPKDRAAMVLRFWYDYSYQEIAATLSLTESAVKSRLHRSRVELAKAWKSGQETNLFLERTKHESPAI